MATSQLQGVILDRATRQMWPVRRIVMLKNHPQIPRISETIVSFLRIDSLFEHLQASLVLNTNSKHIDILHFVWGTAARRLRLTAMLEGH